MANESYTHPEYLVESDWLAAHKDDANVVVVDCDVDAAYNRSHIPGAVVVPDNFEKDPETGRVHLMNASQFQAMCQRLGIGDDTLVITYDNSQSLYAARLWWALNTYGHSNVKVLNGGWRKWVSEGRPAGIDRPKPRPGVKFTPQQDNSLIATTEDLKESHSRPDVAVWDVRSIEEYKGENTRGNQRPGHIPGASHLEWLEMMDMETHTFKPASEMRRILESKGITPDKEVVAH
jgi:thiosulfate/3-mercaptopyruvate sulfurtransferase